LDNTLSFVAGTNFKPLWQKAQGAINVAILLSRTGDLLVKQQSLSLQW